MEYVLEAAGLRKSFGLVHVIRDLSLAVRENECHAIIGPNGAGKSTLFNLISGRFPVTSGTITFKGRDVTRASPTELCRQGLSRSFQISNIFHNMTAFHNVRCAVFGKRTDKYAFWRSADRIREVTEKVDAVLSEVGLLHRRNTLAAALSYSDQRALEIAITIAGDPSVILLDEPTAGMNNEETDAAIGVIRRIGAGRTVIVIEHDMKVVFGLADRISVLVYGEIVATGSPDEIRANAAVQSAYLGEETV